MRQRIQTAILALVVFVPFVLYGGWPFILFVYFMASIGLIELLNMYKIDKYSFPSIISMVSLWVILLPYKEFNVAAFTFTKTEVIILFIMLLMSYTVLAKNKFTFDGSGFMLISTIYVGIGFYFLILTRMMGMEYILFALFVIWATDTGAYFFGRAFGKKKLWPEISPNKTVEGAIGGIVSAGIIGVIFQMVHPFEQSMLIILVVTIGISIVGQVGDLVASAFKRHYKVKDSGKLLPGHGGILDRMDSLLFVSPFLYLIKFIF